MGETPNREPEQRLASALAPQPVPGSPPASTGARLASLLAIAALAVAIPWAAHRHLRHVLDVELEPALGALLGTTVDVGGLTVSLTGTLRLEDVAVGGTLEADAIEAAVSLPTLLAGRLDADEVLLERPRLQVWMRTDGSSNLSRLLAHAASHRLPRGRAQASSRRQLRRIVVTSGDLVIDVPGRGRVALAGLELHPHQGGVRLLARAADVELTAGTLRAHGQLGRIGADIELRRARLTRFLAVGGALELKSGEATTHLREVQVATGLGAEPGVRLAARAGSRGRVELAVYPGASPRAELVAEQAPLRMIAGWLPRWLLVGNATASGTATLRMVDDELRFRGSADVQNVLLEHPRLAPEPVPLTARVHARGAVLTEAGERALELDEVAIERSGVRLEAALHATWRGAAAMPARATMTVVVPKTDCMALLTAIPVALRPELAGLELEGQFSGRVALRFDRQAPEATELDAAIDTEACRVAREADAGDPASLRTTFSFQPQRGPRRHISPGDDAYVSLGRLPEHVWQAFVAAEDGRFFAHHGFDLHQIERSLAVNIAAGSLVRGGSTISQQLVKNVFLSTDRSLARKLAEAVLTWRVEARLEKRLILERYLNVIELGPQLHGLRDGARAWLGKEPKQLSAREAAFLAALTPAPRTLSAHLQNTGGVDGHMNHRIDIVLRAMRRDGYLNSDALAAALRDRVRLVPQALPRP